MRPFVAALFCVFVAVVAYNSKDFNKIKISNNQISGKHVRQNYSPVSNKAVNKQINECLNSGYQFLAISFFFDRADVALPGFHKYFKDASDREMARAHVLMKYMNMRGGDLILTKISSPGIEDWSDGLSALKKGLKISKRINAKFISMYSIAVKQNDAHLMHYVKTDFLDQQVKIIKEMADYITQLEEVTRGSNSGLGLYILDKDLRK